MEGKKPTAFDKKGSNRTRDSPVVNDNQLKTKTPMGREYRHVSRKPQSRTPASRFRDNRRDAEYTELDDDDDDDDDGDTNDRGNGGDEGHNERNKSGVEENDQITSDGDEDADDARENNSVPSESESERFLNKHGSFRTYLSKKTRREVEKEFLRNKRELIALPDEHEQNAQQKKDQRFCTWALRQIERRIEFLKGEEEERGEGSSSDGLPESDGNKKWKMYGIIAEDDTQYLIAWKGADKKTGLAYDDEWTVKKYVVAKDRREWEAYKRENGQ